MDGLGKAERGGRRWGDIGLGGDCEEKGQDSTSLEFPEFKEVPDGPEAFRTDLEEKYSTSVSEEDSLSIGYVEDQTFEQETLRTSSMWRGSVERTNRAPGDATGGLVQEVIEPAGTVPVVDDDSAVYTFCLAQALVGLKKDDLALQSYKAILDARQQVKEELYIIPYAFGGIGEIHLRKGDLGAAEDALLVAKKWNSGYDFDKPLVRRVKHALGLLKEAKKKQTCKSDTNARLASLVQTVFFSA